MAIMLVQFVYRMVFSKISADVIAEVQFVNRASMHMMQVRCLEDHAWQIGP